MGFVRAPLVQSVQGKEAVDDCGRDGPQGPDLRSREPRCAQILIGGVQHGSRRHGIELALDPGPDRRGARCRNLLADDDPDKSLEAGLALAQNRRGPFGDEARNDAIARRQRREPGLESGFQIEEGRHQTSMS